MNHQRLFQLPEYLALTLVITCCFPLRADATPEAPPHIVLLVADDMGWADVGYHDSEIATPHIDRLAKGGTVLEQFYVQPTCSPTRAALLTGRYSFRMGMQRQVIRPWHSKGLPLNERLLPEVLREAGYETAICGKWHLGTASPEYRPMARGFDHQYGHLGGHIDYFEHTYYGARDWHRDQKPLQEKGYSTDLIARESVRLIEEHDVDKPLFLYVAFNAPHAPLQAPEAYLQRYAGIEDSKRRTYAAMVTCMDDGIGEILGALDRKKLSADTLVFFCSDNGGAESNSASNLPLRGKKGDVYEGGIRVPAIVSWPGKIVAGASVVEPLHVADLFPTLAKLAGAKLESTLPLDGKDMWGTIADGKASPHEEIVHNSKGYADAIRRGDWKLVYARPTKDDKYGYELFNIADDPNETTNLMKKQPDIFQDLKRRLTEHQKRAVMPDGLKPLQKPDGWKAPGVWDFSEPVAIVAPL